jgi:hypothetical protein
LINPLRCWIRDKEGREAGRRKGRKERRRRGGGRGEKVKSRIGGGRGTYKTGQDPASEKRQKNEHETPESTQYTHIGRFEVKSSILDMGYGPN